MSELKCVYSIVRFVEDPVRDEPRNIGVLFQCPEEAYLDGMFTRELRKKLSGVTEPIDIEILEEYLLDFEGKFEQSKKWRAASQPLFELPDYLRPGFLELLSDNGFDKIVFTRPKGILSTEPTADLERIFNRFVEVPRPIEAEVIEKPATEFRGSVESLFRERKLLSRTAVRPRYPVEVREHKFSCDFGYRARREVLIEAVDLTSEVFQVRLRHFSPTAIKFKLVKEDRPNTSRIALLKTPPQSNGDLKIEHSTLREFATDVIDFGREQAKLNQLLERVEKETSGTGRLFGASGFRGE